MNFKNVAVLFFAYLGVTIAIAIGVYFFLEYQERGRIRIAEHINEAGRLRMLSQKVAKGSVALTYGKNTQTLSSNCKSVQEDFIFLEGTYNTLREPEFTDHLKKDVFAELNENHVIIAAQLARTEKALEDLSLFCEGLKTQAAADDAVTEILALSESLLKLFDNNVTLLQMDAKYKSDFAKQTHGWLLGIAIGIYVLFTLLIALPTIKREKKIRQFEKKTVSELQELNQELAVREEELTQTIDQMHLIAQQMQENEGNLSAIMDFSNLEIWSVNKDGLLLKGNQSFKDNFEHSVGFVPIEGKTNLFTAFGKSKLTPWTTYYHRAFDGEEVTFEINRNGEIFQVDINPIFNRNEVVVGAVGFVKNVSEARKSAETLRINAERLNLALQHSKQGMWDWDLVTDEVIFNETFLNLHGYEKQEAETSFAFWEKHIHDSHKKLFWEQVDDAKNPETSTSLSFDYKGLRKNGTSVWLRVQGKIVSYHKDTPARMIGTVQDITERKRDELKLRELFETERELNEELTVREEELTAREEELSQYVFELESVKENIERSEKRLRMVIDNLPVGAVLVQGENLFINKKCADIVGFSQDEIKKDTDWFTKIYKGLDPKQVQAQYKQILKSGYIDNFLSPIFHKNGDRKIIEFGGYDFGDGVVWTLNDITEKRRAERALVKNEKAVRELYEISSETNLTLEQKIKALLDLGREYFKMDLAIFSNINREKQEYIVKEVSSENTPVKREEKFNLQDTYCVQILNKESTVAIEDVTKTDRCDFPAYHRFKHKSYIGAAVYVHDELLGSLHFSDFKAKKYHFTESQKDLLNLMADWLGAELESELTHKQLVAAKELAEDAARVKADFLATMSHEIRTPMNGVIGMTSLLLQTGLSNEQLDYVNTIRLSGDALLSVINDILDFSKIEAGNMSLEEFPFEISQCVEEAVELLSSKVTEKKLDLLYFVDPQVPDMVEGDITRLRQVLINLISNAIKFTAQGEIVIRVQLIEKEGNKAKIHFSVRDSGVGISKEQQQKLFKAFSQADSSTTRKYGGTGLGLAICKKLVTLMGGEIWVESEAGEGSDFQFTIEQGILIQDKKPSNKLNTDVLDNKKALIIDDSETNLRILQKQFELWGMSSICVNTSKKGVELALKDDFDLVVMDFEMPDMDGVEATEKIREQKDKKELPVILLSSAYPELTEERKNYLFSGYYMKPTRHSLLQKSLIRLLSDNQLIEQSTEVSPKEVKTPQMQLNILLAEDNVVNQKLATLTMKNLGYDIDVVANGIEAVDAVVRQEYDVVFMDVQMPEMDGVEATHEIIKKLGRKRPPIVAMTANAMEGDREKFLGEGMDDYISKPISVDALKNVLNRIAKNKSARNA